MKKILYCLMGIALIAACSPNREQRVKDIEEHEQQLSTIDISSDDSDAVEMVNLYLKFANDFADDSLAPVYMMRAAELSINLGQTEQAVGLLDSVISIYPGFEDIAGCMFLKGYAYESGEQYEEAKEAYTQFVESYPDHYLAQDTKKMLQYIGMSPEAMFEAVMNSATDENLTL